MTVAGRPLSLDDIEHGILRRSRWKLGLGCVPLLRPPAFELAHRVDRVDPRIHFGLNRSAASLPPLAAYRAERLDARLDSATRSYLASAVDTRGSAIVVPPLILWFIGDFDGPPGVRRFLRRHAVAGWGRRLRFSSWDWTARPGRWAALKSGPGRGDKPRRRRSSRVPPAPPLR